MRQILFIIVLIFPIRMLGNVSVSISGEMDNSAVKTIIESTVSALLTEINDAQAAGRAIELGAMDMTTWAQEYITTLLNNYSLFCPNDVIVENCVTTNTGYQVRNVPLELIHIVDSDSNKVELQNAVISFDKNGQLNSFYLGLSDALYEKAIKKNIDTIELRHRQIIIDFVEHLKTAYYTKEKEFLEQVFNTSKRGFSKEDSYAYMNRLNRVFERDTHIKAMIDEIKIIRHPSRMDFYEMTLYLGYSSNNYIDSGYLFVLWCFVDGKSPELIECIWQPNLPNGDRIPEEDLISLSDFDF